LDPAGPVCQTLRVGVDPRPRLLTTLGASPRHGLAPLGRPSLLGPVPTDRRPTVDPLDLTSSWDPPAHTGSDPMDRGSGHPIMVQWGRMAQCMVRHIS